MKVKEKEETSIPNTRYSGITLSAFSSTEIVSANSEAIPLNDDYTALRTASVFALVARNISDIREIQTFLLRD